MLGQPSASRPRRRWSPSSSPAPCPGWISSIPRPGPPRSPSSACAPWPPFSPGTWRWCSPASCWPRCACCPPPVERSWSAGPTAASPVDCGAASASRPWRSGCCPSSPSRLTPPSPPRSLPPTRPARPERRHPTWNRGRRPQPPLRHLAANPSDLLHPLLPHLASNPSDRRNHHLPHPVPPLPGRPWPSPSPPFSHPGRLQHRPRARGRSPWPTATASGRWPSA